MAYSKIAGFVLSFGIASSAAASTGSDSGGYGDSGYDGGDDTETQGTDTGYSTDSDGATTNDWCGDNCTSQGATPSIVAPLDGATVPSTFNVSVDAPAGCWCDTCGCNDDPVFYVAVHVDGENLASCQNGCWAEGFELTLAPGQHTLELIVETSYSSQNSVPIVIVVQDAEVEPDTTGNAPADLDPETTGVSSPAEEEEEEGGLETRGCGCNASDPSPAALVFLLLPFALRRRAQVATASSRRTTT